jgi:hypothetical protein
LVPALAWTSRPFVTNSSAVVNEEEHNEGGDGTPLEALERAIDQETETLADLRRRTRTLEIEIAGWKVAPRPAPRPARTLSVGGVEAIIGMLLGAVSTAIAWNLFSILFLGGN